MPLLTASELAEHFAGLDDCALQTLLRARPDLLQPTPGDFLGLAVRAQSELSLRQHLQRLDSHTLRTLLRAAERAAGTSGAPGHDGDRGGDALDPAEHHAAEQAALALLRAHALVLPAEPLPRTGSDDGGPAPSSRTEPGVPTHAPVEVPANLPHVLESLQLPAEVRRASENPPGPEGATVPPALVENASLSAVGELLSAVEDLLTVLALEPAATLRTGGVGMRELRRLTAERTGERRTEDTQAGETGWLLEVAAAGALITLDVDTGRWRPAESAERWRGAPRHRRHQLLVSGWLLSPRSPLLLRGPHPSARIAPALTQDRQRGDAPTLRQRLLRTASALTAEGPHRIWEVDLPDDDLPPAEALRGTLADRMAWERPLLIARVRPLLAPMVREAERLGLLAAGTVSAAGHALVQATARSEAQPGSSEEPLAEAALTEAAPLEAMAAAVAGALPPLSETVHLQSDLTAVPAGPLTPQLERALAETAEKETRGGVPTYRFTSSSLGAALSQGWTAESLVEFLRRHSSGDLPSPLRTLIDDAVRTRRPVRIGGASSWLVEEDPETRAALLAQPELQGLGLRPLEGDVLICEASPAELAAALQDGGVHVHREDDGGGHRAHDIRGTGRRASRFRDAADAPDLPEGWTLAASPWQQSPVRTLTPERLARNPQLLQEAVARLRSPAAEGLKGAGAGDDVVARLRSAAKERRPVRVARVSADGQEHRITGVPTALNAGRVRLRGEESEEEAVLLLHRVTFVEVL